MDQHLISPESPRDTDRRAAIAHHMAALEELADPAARAGGWTPFARRLFLQTLAETGRVTIACDYAGLTKQSAYALRARDPLFAAGWDAACELARMPLADALYEAALDGLTETITRPDGQTLTRHRFDSRLSIAVLHRLDRRCDRAAQMGARHRGAVASWDAVTAAVGSDDATAALAILEPPPHGQASQAGGDAAGHDATDGRLWWDDVGEEWRTDFSPPDDFVGDEHDPPGGPYWRTLGAQELAIIERDCANADQAKRLSDATARDDFFAAIEESLDPHQPDCPPPRHPGPDPGSAVPPPESDPPRPSSADVEGPDPETIAPPVA